MSLVHTLPQQIWTVWMLAVAGLSVWRGGWAERTVAFGMIVSSIATAVFQNKHDWSATQWADLVGDIIYLVLLFWVAFRSKRLWPLFPAGFQLVIVILYAARMADHRVGARAPFVAEEIFSYLILLAVGVGVWQRAKDRRAELFPPSTATGSSAT